MGQFLIGDRVQCIDDGLTFPSYFSWVRNNAPDYFEAYKNSRFVCEDVNSDGICGMVVSVAPHGDPFCHGDIALVVDDIGHALLIDVNGLTSCE